MATAGKEQTLYRHYIIEEYLLEEESRSIFRSTTR